MLLRNLSRIDLNLLHVFVVIHQEASITRAAEVLNLSQPAVSNRVAKLRSLFGDPLFVRAGNGVAPTPLAQRLIVPVREALSTLERAFGEHEPFDPATSHRILRFSMSDFAEAILLAPLVGELSSTGSRMKVENFFVPERDLHEKLASGELDFAIEFRPPSEPNLRRVLLMEDEFVCVMRSGHPALEGEFTLGAYLQLEHLHIFNRPRFSNLVDGALAAAKQRRRVTVSIEHCLAVGSILAMSDLCVTIPRIFVERFLPDEGFAMRPTPFPMAPLQTWLLWHPATERSPAHGWVKQIMQRLTASRDEQAAGHSSQ